MAGVDLREQSSSNWLSPHCDKGSLQSSHFYASWTTADRQSHVVPCVAVPSWAEVFASECKHGDQECGESDLAFIGLLNALSHSYQVGCCWRTYQRIFHFSTLLKSHTKSNIISYIQEAEGIVFDNKVWIPFLNWVMYFTWPLLQISKLIFLKQVCTLFGCRPKQVKTDLILSSKELWKWKQVCTEPLMLMLLLHKLDLHLG